MATDVEPQDAIHLPMEHGGKWRPSSEGTLAAAGSCWAAFLLVVYAVGAGHASQLDEVGLLFWRGDAPHFLPRGSPLLLEIIRDLTSLGGVLLRNMIALAAIIALVFMRLRWEAFIVAVTVGVGWLINSLMKEVVGRERPSIVPHLTEAGGASFPSGHSFNSAAVFIAVALALARLSTRHSARTTLICSAIALSLAVAWSRVWLGVHFPTDVIAGWLGGAGWALLVAAWHRPSSR